MSIIKRLFFLMASIALIPLESVIGLLFYVILGKWYTPMFVILFLWGIDESGSLKDWYYVNFKKR